MEQAIGFGLLVLCIVLAVSVVGRTWVDGKRTPLRLVLTLFPSMLAPVAAAAVTTADWYVVPVIALVVSIVVYVASCLVHRKAKKYNVQGESRATHRWFHRARALSDVAFGLFNGIPFALFAYAVFAL